jgi:hypothetical protein
VASAGWAKWTPINAAAIGAHLIGAAGELATESGRVATQKGVAGMSAIKTALTVAALAATGYSRMLGMQIEHAGSQPSHGVTEPSEMTPPDIAASQRKIKVLQWVVPALTGALIVVTSFAGEQQKSGQVMRGIVGRAGGLARMPLMLARSAAMGNRHR